jgi:ribosomal protein S18 acetylase RimI-like enzyme
MTDVADLLARAEAARAVVPASAGVASEVVEGVPCVSHPIGLPWACQAKAMVPPSPVVLRAVTAWLDAHALATNQWTVMTRQRHVDAPVFTERGLTPWLEMPVLTLGRADLLVQVPEVDGLEVGPVSEPADFLAVFGQELAPLITPGVLADPTQHHLVGRIAGQPVGCAQVREVMDTAYISGITVVPAYRGRGIGSAISAAATRFALTTHPRVVWLAAERHLHQMYGRLGFRQVGVHVLLRPDG